MVYFQTTIALNIGHARAHLSGCLDKPKPGERISLIKRSVPIVEIRALQNPPTKPRAIGLAEGSFQVPTSFFDPSLEDVIAEFDDRNA